MPSEWSIARLGDLTHRITKGTTPTTAGGQFTDSGVTFIKVESIGDSGNLNLQRLSFIDEQTHELLARSKLQAEDILFTIAGTIGRVALVPSSILPANTNQAVAIIRANRKMVNPFFLYYALRDEQRVQHARARVVQSVQANFSLSELSSIQIPLPPMSVQEAIAEILRTLDDKIELNRRMSETLEEVVRELYNSWFSPEGCVSNPAFVTEPYSTWRPGTLGDLAAEKRQVVKPESMDSDTPYIGLEHMPRRRTTLDAWGSAEGLGSNKYQFERSDILFGKLRPYFHKVGVAPVNGVCSTDIVVVQPIDENYFGFLLGLLSSDEFVRFTDSSSTGTRMPRTSWKTMSSFEVRVPPLSVARTFDEFVRPIVARTINATFENKTLSQLRDTLLPKLLSGELRVPDAEQLVSEAV